ncbi:MAG: hypothetical protein HY613_06880 [Candidatus Rokubacteria bacterium]|nr:hypothetical protein [Candidatus Rokubacteria bacterium]
MRPLLRWISLIGSGAVLYGLGVARFHHQNFSLFLALLLALAVLTVVVFLLTRDAGLGTRREPP